MSKHHLKYILEDTKQGLKRNISSSIASVILLCITLCLIGLLLLTRTFLAETIDYIESQLAMKVYVEQGLTEQVADVLRQQSYVSKVEIETGEDMMEGLTSFFAGKEHLLESFTDGTVPDAVKFHVQDDAFMKTIATNLEQVDGITKVVYPQQMAEVIADWIVKIELYGSIAIIVFLILAFVIVYITFHLAAYQRSGELKVKLLLGMNPKLVRMQFLLEGFLLGIAGVLGALVVTFCLYVFIFQQIQQAMPYIGQMTWLDVVCIMLIQLVLAMAISLCASYLSTRKLIDYV